MIFGGQLYLPVVSTTGRQTHARGHLPEIIGGTIWCWRVGLSMSELTKAPRDKRHHRLLHIVSHGGGMSLDGTAGSLRDRLSKQCNFFTVDLGGASNEDARRWRFLRGEQNMTPQHGTRNPLRRPFATRFSGLDASRTLAIQNTRFMLCRPLRIRRDDSRFSFPLQV